MFTAKPQKNRNAATTYFDEHLSHNDYYTQGETQAGYWVGQGAQRLGLKEGEAVNREAFLRLCDNQRPDSGEQLTQRQFAGRRVFFDFTCSAPKSVSILAVTMDDKRLLQAHREASDVALKELEAYAGTRVRKGGAMEDRTTANLVGAAFRHTSSRALDPQLHTHFTLFNATLDPVEQRWKALQSSRMYDAIKYGTAVYRNELANRLHGLGYGTRQTAHGFEIQGVDSKIISRFSKRSKQRDEAVARKEERLGRRLTKDEVSNVVHKSRPKKLKDASESEVRGQQLNELGFFEKRALKRVIAEANGQRLEPAEQVQMGQATDYAIAHVFSRQSVVPEHELLEASLVKGYGQVRLAELKAALQTDRKLVKVGAEYSTREILTSELRLIHTVNAGLNALPPMAEHFPFSPKISADQKAALDLVIKSPDRVTGFQGQAGTGKTTALKELDQALTVNGFTPVFCAPTAAATDVLRKDGFKDAVTLAKFLSEQDTKGTMTNKSVVVLDEAGAVGTADMLRLLQTAHAGRVVLVGDTGQHTAVAQGDALRLIEEHSSYRFGRLTEIRRQKTETLREVVALAAARKPAEAFQKLQAQGEVVEIPSGAVDAGQLYQKAAAAYLSAVDHGKVALLVSPTWAEIEAVTTEVRAQLRQRGSLAAKEEKVRTFDSLGWTDAQKGLVSHYEPGSLVRFVKQTEHFKAGEIAEVVKVERKTVFLRGMEGKEIAFHPSRSPSSFDAGQKRELAVAAGDWLLLQANGGGFINGERVQVKETGPSGFALKDGRTLPASYRTFTHGYAVTSHAAQGKTVDEVVVVASSRSFAAVSQESFYVGISRARERAQVFTDDASLLGERVLDRHTRKAALELQGLREELAKHGLLKIKPPVESVSTRASVAVKNKEVPEEARRESRAFRVMRTLRQDVAQRLTQWGGELQRWVGERIGQTHTAAPRISRELTARQRLMVTPPRQSQSPDGPRQSRGYRI